MSVTFVIGRAGGGKTTRCFREIVDAARADPLGPAILWIVPKQQTFMAERMLTCESGLGAVCRVRVLSFDQLATEALAAVGGAAAAQVTALGRQMILGHLLRRLQPRLNYYKSSARQVGLAAELDATFGEIERSGLTNAEMEAALSELETHHPDAAGTSLLAKLRDLRLVYDAYRAFLGQDRLDPHRRQTEVVALLRDWPLLRGAAVYVDGFLDFSDDERRTLAVLAVTCPRLHVTLPIDPASPTLRDLHRVPDDMSLFRRTEEAYRRLWFTFAEAGVVVDDPVLLTTGHRFGSHPALGEVERFTFSGDEDARPQVADQSLHFLVAPDRALEVETVARHVRTLLHDGLRLRDVAVLARNLDDYAALIDSAFREHGIACFVDRRRTAGHHPLLQFVRSALQIARFDWPHDSVMALLKTGLACLGPDEADELEDYVLLHRVRGGTAWETAEPWAYRRDLTRSRADRPDNDDDAPSPARAAAGRVDRHRRTLHDRLRPLIALARAKEPPLLRAFVTTLFETLEACSVRQTLSNWMRAAADAGDFEQHDEHAQVWAELCALLEQMTDLLGDECVSASEFAEIFESGLERFDLAITPPTLDQVLVGQVDRTRTPPGLRACFVLGLSAGDFPRAARDATVLTDADRRELRTRKLDLGGDSRQALLDERLLGYLAFTRASDHLFVSRPLTTDGDRAAEPSVFWQRLRDLFPDAPVTLVPPQRDASLADAWTPRQFATCLMEWARGDVCAPDGKEAAYHWLASQGPSGPGTPSPLPSPGGRGGTGAGGSGGARNTKVPLPLPPGEGRGEGVPGSEVHPQPTDTSNPVTTILRAWRALGYANDADLSPQVSRQLFPPPLRATAARLETFAACAFRHFLRYGLALTEREPPGVTGVDLSRVYHHVLQALVSSAVRDGIDLTDPNAPITDATIASLVADVGKSLRGELMISSARNTYLLNRVERTLREVVAAHREMLRRGSMRPARSAISFGTGSGLPAVKVTTASGSEAAIAGTIDRLDALPDGSGLAVYDYRLGSRQLSLQEVYHGLSLQLLTGLLALQGTGQPAAAFYLQTTRGTGSVKHPDEALEPSDPKFLLRVKPRGVVQGDFVPAFDASLSEGSSEVIQVSIRKSDGGFGNRRASDVADKAEFEALLAHVRKQLGDLADAVLSGEIGIHPYRIGTDTPCPGCSYRAVCRFDPAVDHYRNFTPMSKEQVFERMTQGSSEAPSPKPQ